MKIPFVIGHRGASGSAPENTLASIKSAAAQGGQWVELDVRLLRDGTAVIFHDARLNRTTDGRGRIAGHNLDGVKGLDAGSWFDPDFAGERIPTLERAMGLATSLGLGVNLEIKPVRGRGAATARRLAEILKSISPLPPLLVSSFDIRAMSAFDGWLKALLVGRVPRDWRARLETGGCSDLHCADRHLNEAVAGEVAGAGVALRCYTVNDPGRAAALRQWGVAGIFTDFPGRMAGLTPASGGATS